MICRHCRDAVIFTQREAPVIATGIGYLRRAVHAQGRQEACPDGKHTAAPYEPTPEQEAA